MAEREVFANAPLRLVALELRFPTTSRVLTRTLWDSFERALGSELTEVEVLVDDVDTHVPAGTYESVLRRTTDDRKRAVTLHAGAATIELANYRSFADLVELTKATLDGLELAATDDGLRCVGMGLRYINEIRSELVHTEEYEWQSPQAWLPYVNQDLVQDVTAPLGMCAYALRGQVAFHDLESQEFVRLDYGAHPHGLIETDGVLSLAEASGPCFVLDIDGFVGGSPKQPVAADSSAILKALDALHDAVERVFDWSITDRLKDEVLRVSSHPVEAGEGGMLHVRHA